MKINFLSLLLSRSLIIFLLIWPLSTPLLEAELSYHYVKSPLSGTIKNIFIKENSVITEGQLLIQFEDLFYKESLNKALMQEDKNFHAYQALLSTIDHLKQKKNELNQYISQIQDRYTLKKEYYKYKKLGEDALLVKKELEQIMRERDLLEDQITIEKEHVKIHANTISNYANHSPLWKNAIRAIKNTKIISTADGVILRLFVKPGSTVKKGDILFTYK